MKLEHYARRLAQKTGTPILEDIILEKKRVNDLPHNCMPWSGARTFSSSHRLRTKVVRDYDRRPYKHPVVETPYGLIVVEGRRLLVHRYIFMLVMKSPAEFNMRNECGNTLCCNLLHWSVRGMSILLPAREAEPIGDFNYDDEPWTQKDVNWLLDQALSNYTPTTWEELIGLDLMQDCPHEMVVRALQYDRKLDLLPGI